MPIISLALLLTSCATEPKLSYVGDTFALNDIKAPATVAETAAPDYNGTVYWTSGGEVYHKRPDCGALSRSKEIFSGTEGQADDAGKSRPCQKCS